MILIHRNPTLTAPFDWSINWLIDWSSHWQSTVPPNGFTNHARGQTRKKKKKTRHGKTSYEITCVYSVSAYKRKVWHRDCSRKQSRAPHTAQASITDIYIGLRRSFQCSTADSPTKTIGSAECTSTNRSRAFRLRWTTFTPGEHVMTKIMTLLKKNNMLRRINPSKQSSDSCQSNK